MPWIHSRIVTSTIDVLVLDNNLEHAFDLITELRHSYPRLFIVLVNQDANFGMPGQADEDERRTFRKQWLDSPHHTVNVGQGG